jgi:hypothetical protein
VSAVRPARGAAVPLAAAAVLVALAAPPAARCAGAQYFAGLVYAPGGAVGHTRDLVGSPGWTGFTFEARRAVHGTIATGVVLGTNVFTGSAPTRLSTDHGVVTDLAQQRLIYTTVLFAVDWFGGDRTATVRPFVGAGAGMYFVNQRAELSADTAETTVWHLGLAPEAGVAIRISPRAHATLIARYNHPFRNGPYLDNDVHAYPFFTIGVGAAVLTF